MDIKTFFDPQTYTLTYVVFDPRTRDAVVIDPVLDYDAAAVRTSRASLTQVVEFVRQEQLKVHFVLETHAHADHLSSGHDLVTEFFSSAQLAIGRNITQVQATFKKIFNLPPDFKTDGSQFDRLLDDGEEFAAGSLQIQVIHTPGHTPACVSYLIGDAVFTGDALFMPDYGTGRCDFPGGDSHQLYDSVHRRLYALPDTTRVFVGHDYQPGGRALAYETTIGASKAGNLQLKAITTEAEFVAFRTKRDATLAAPKLLFPSIQVNIAAGRLPEPEDNGTVYLKLPLTITK